jgi:indolepyruvate ferredoxin oxidoreductase alpha subunit
MLDARNSPRRNTDRIVLAPASYLHEREKIELRWPSAVKFIEDHQLNEIFDGDADDIGIIVQGGIYNTVMRALQTMGLADAFGETRVPVYVLNVTYPLVDSEVVGFCAGKRAILLVEEGQPKFIEHSINAILRRAAVQTRCEGKSMLPMAGQYTGDVIKAGIVKFLDAYRPDLLPAYDPTSDRSGGVSSCAECAGTSAVILHRMSRAPDLRRHQAGKARARPSPHQLRHWLPSILDAAAG